MTCPRAASCPPRGSPSASHVARVARVTIVALFACALGACASTGRNVPAQRSRVTYEPAAREAAPGRVRSQPRPGRDDAPPTSCRYAELVLEAGAEYDVDPAVIAEIATIESGWIRRA